MAPTEDRLILPCDCGEDSHLIVAYDKFETYPAQLEFTLQYRGRVRDRLRDVWRLLTGQPITDATVVLDEANAAALQGWLNAHEAVS